MAIAGQVGNFVPANQLGFLVGADPITNGVVTNGIGRVRIFDYAESTQAAPKGHAEEDRSEAQRSYFCDWRDRQKAVAGLLGFATIAPGAVAPYTSRQVPHSLPDWTITDFGNGGVPYLFCTAVDWSGYAPVGVNVNTTTMVPGGEKAPQHVLCRLDCKYTTPTYEIFTDAQMKTAGHIDRFGNPDESSWGRYCTVEVKAAGEFFSLLPTDPGGYLWVFDGVRVQQNISKLVVYANLAVTRYGVPWNCMPSFYVNTTQFRPQAIDLALGTVNSVGLNGRYLPGTMLLTAVQIRPKRSAFGLRVYDYTTYHKFVANANPGEEAFPGHGHNELFRQRNSAGAFLGEWQETTIGGATNLANGVTGKSIYNWFDHRRLWQNP